MARLGSVLFETMKKGRGKVKTGASIYPTPVDNHQEDHQA